MRAPLGVLSSTRTKPPPSSSCSLQRLARFESYFGIPFSVDMGFAYNNRTEESWSEGDYYGCTPLPLMVNATVFEQPANLATVNARYVQTAREFPCAALRLKLAAWHHPCVLKAGSCVCCRPSPPSTLSAARLPQSTSSSCTWPSGTSTRRSTPGKSSSANRSAESSAIRSLRSTRETLPLPCISTAFAAKALPLPCVFHHNRS